MFSKCIFQEDRQFDRLSLFQTLHMLYFLESLWEMEVNYDSLRVIDSYLDDHDIIQVFFARRRLY